MQPKHRGHAIIHMHKIAPLFPIRDTFAVRGEKGCGLSGHDLVEFMQHHTRHAALMVFIRAIDIEET